MGDVRSPWNLGCSQWPLKASTLEEKLKTPGFISDASHEWSSFCGHKIQQDPSLPKQIPPHEYCLNRVPKCLGKTPAGLIDAAANLMRDLQLIVCPRRKKLSPGQFVLLKFNDRQQVLCILAYLKAPFTCEILAFPSQPRRDDILGSVLSFSSVVSEISPDLWTLKLETEVEWSYRIGESLEGDGALEWAGLDVKTPRPAAGQECVRLCDIQVAKMERVDVAAERLAQRKSDEVSAAMRAFNASAAPWQPRQQVKRVAKEGQGPRLPLGVFDRIELPAKKDDSLWWLRCQPIAESNGTYPFVSRVIRVFCPSKL